MFPSSIYIHVNILSPLILFWAPRVRPLTKANNDLDGQIQLSVSVALVAHPAAFDMMILSWTLAAYLPSALCFLDRSHELEVYRANSVSPLPPICSPPACLSIVSKCQFHTSGGFDQNLGVIWYPTPTPAPILQNLFILNSQCVLKLSLHHCYESTTSILGWDS